MDPEARESIRLAAVERIVSRIGVSQQGPHLEEAFTHPSLTNEQSGSTTARVPDNQRLEFLGDSVLGLCVSEILMASGSTLDEGQLTFMRAALVNASTLAELARELELGDALRLGRGADAHGERNRPNVLADALEALVGAIYLDAGLGEARRVVGLLVGDRVRQLVATGGAERDPKSRLQEWLQANALPPPKYRVVAEQGPPHAREFWVEGVVVLDSPLAEGSEADEVTEDGAPRWSARATGQGRSKKLAEQAAARALLELVSGAST